MDRRPKAVDIVTLPYPGFATDLQPQFIALNAVSEGAAMVTARAPSPRARLAAKTSKELSSPPEKATTARPRGARFASRASNLAAASMFGLMCGWR